MAATPAPSVDNFFHNWFQLQADKEDPVSMGDPKKELGEDDFDKFDAKKSEAMGVFSEGNIFYRNIT